jgi:hypothetical protein
MAELYLSGSGLSSATDQVTLRGAAGGAGVAGLLAPSLGTEADPSAKGFVDETGGAVDGAVHARMILRGSPYVKCLAVRTLNKLFHRGNCNISSKGCQAPSSSICFRANFNLS